MGTPDRLPARAWGRLTSWLPRPRYLAVIVFFAYGKAVFRLRSIKSPDDLYYDAREVWFPLSQEVLGGARLYLEAPDNKPPLFQFLNLSVAATGEYIFVFIILLATANVAVAILLVGFCTKRGHRRLGVLAAILLLLTIPVGWGVKINPRQFAAIGILLAFLATGPIYSGVALATAGLFSQFAVLLTPVVIYDQFGGFDVPTQYLQRFAGAGVVVATLSYAAVGIVWGPSAAVSGVEQTILVAGQYASSQSDSLLAAPVLWSKKMFRFALSIPLVLVFAGVGVFTVLRGRTPPRIVVLSVLCAGILSVQYVIRAGGVYTVLLYPFLSVLAAFGIYTILTEAETCNPTENPTASSGMER